MVDVGPVWMVDVGPVHSTPHTLAAATAAAAAAARRRIAVAGRASCVLLAMHTHAEEDAQCLQDAWARSRRAMRPSKTVEAK